MLKEGASGPFMTKKVISHNLLDKVFDEFLLWNFDVLHVHYLDGFPGTSGHIRRQKISINEVRFFAFD